jgi:hypothetical protein
MSPGQFKIVTGVQLHIATESTIVDVHYDSVEVATEQLKAEEKQRVFGIIPNFYVSYDKDPAPLTAKMKFQLALKVSMDPVTTAGVLFVASARQAANRMTSAISLLMVMGLVVWCWRVTKSGDWVRYSALLATALVACRGATVTKRASSGTVTGANPCSPMAAFRHQQHGPAASAVTNSLRQATSCE